MNEKLIHKIANIDIFHLFVNKLKISLNFILKCFSVHYESSSYPLEEKFNPPNSEIEVVKNV